MRNAWLLVLACGCAAPHVEYGAGVDTADRRSFAALVSSIVYSSYRFCCTLSVVVLRPQGRWELYRVEGSLRSFQAAADSAAFRGVADRLIGFGATLDWPPDFGTRTSDVSWATISVRAAGQCHQTMGTEHQEETLPREWLAATALLDSLIARVNWTTGAPPDSLAGSPLAIGARWLCGDGIDPQ